MLCIKNGIVVDGINPEPYKADILVDGKEIIEIASEISTVADVTIDAAGKCVLPGFVDAHCHLREPGYEYKEDIGSEPEARQAVLPVLPVCQNPSGSG